MNMSKLMKKIYVACFGVLTLASCSDIAENERVVELVPPTIARTVLIEDFTGQKCINCPDAIELIGKLQEVYGHENLVAVGIHCGAYGRKTPLYTEEGDYLYQKYGVENQPSGMIDRQGVMNTSQWGKTIYDEIQRYSPLALSVSNAYNAGDGSVEITVKMETASAVAGNLNVWLTEDGIVSPQYLSDGSADVDYVHNHVYRKAVTPLDGQAIEVVPGHPETRTFTVQIQDGWKAENMAVVAFVDSAHGVVNTTKAELLTK